MALPSANQLIFSNRASFFMAGFCIAAWAPMIPFVKDRFGLDEHNLGLLLLCVGIGSFISMPTSSWLSSRFGCRAPIFVSALIVALCLVSIPFISNIYLLGLVLFIMGINAVALDVISNIAGALVEQVTARNIMSGLHGLYSVGGFCGSLSVTFLLSAGLPLHLAGIYAAAILLIVTLLGSRNLLTTVYFNEHNQPLSRAQYLENEASKRQTASASGAQRTSHWQYYLHPIVLLIGLMCFIMFMTEGSMLDWSGVFLHTERGFALEHAGYGYAAFAIMMTMCRLTGDKVVTKLGRKRVLLASTWFIIAGFILAVRVEHYLAAFIGFALIGVGASNVVPQLVSVTARIKEVPPHISVAIVNAIGFTGVLVGPALIGFLAHAITLSNTYLCQAGGVFLVFLLSLYLSRKLGAQISAVHGAAATAADAAEATATNSEPAEH